MQCFLCKGFYLYKKKLLPVSPHCYLAKWNNLMKYDSQILKKGKYSGVISRITIRNYYFPCREERGGFVFGFQNGNIEYFLLCIKGN